MEHITEGTLLVLDIGDVSKKYAEKMEHLDKVRDGSEGEITKSDGDSDGGGILCNGGDG
jgi:hypothetical protein